MNNVQSMLLFFSILVGILLIWVAILQYQVYKMKQHYKKLMKGVGIDDLKQAWDVHLQKIEKLFAATHKISEAQMSLGKKVQGVVQKIGFMRYNPLGDVGGDQSFVIALLDGFNSGVVINSMHSRSGTRIYAKKIEEGKSSHTMSEEEDKILQVALQQQ